MKRAEKRALEVYPIESHEMYDDMYKQRGAYVKGYEKGYQEAQAHTIDKACKCYCDHFCEQSRCGMCFHKYDHEQQVKSTFNYTECDDLQFIRKNLLE